MSENRSIFSSPGRDMLAGTIVFLIALPLCLGIAQASGAPPFAGIISGVIGGIVIGSVSRSALSVSGPAAGLIAIVATALAKMPSYEIFLCAVMVAGALQIILSIVRAGGIANYFPSSVIEGMLAGIGLTIIIKEFPNAVGYSRKAQHGVGTEGDDSFTWSDITGAMDHFEVGAILISGIGLIILAIWLTKPFREKLRLVPAGLLVVVIGTLINEFLLKSGSPHALDPDRLVNLRVPKTAGDFISQLTLPDFKGFLDPQVWVTGTIIAVVASIESLLCIEATDKLDPLKRYTPGDGELRAQGIGNLVSGLVGGLPLTSVIIRSSANINAGARTKMSTIFHGSLLLLCVALMPVVLNHIPEAALSAILIFTGYRLCRPSAFRHMWKEGGYTQFVPFIATVILVPWKGLLVGVGVGLAIAIVFMLLQNLKLPYYYQRSSYSNGELIKLTLAQEVSFLNKASIKETLNALPEGANVIIDASETGYIDFDVLDLIRDFQRTQAPDKNIKLSLIGFRNTYKVDAGEPGHRLSKDFLDHAGLPERSAGGHRKLLAQLRNLTGTGNKKGDMPS